MSLTRWITLPLLVFTLEVTAQEKPTPAPAAPPATTPACWPSPTAAG